MSLQGSLFNLFEFVRNCLFDIFTILNIEIFQWVVIILIFIDDFLDFRDKLLLFCEKTGVISVWKDSYLIYLAFYFSILLCFL